MNYELELKNYYNNKFTALVGRRNGEQLLSRLKNENIILKDIEKEYSEIHIVFPQYLVTMNKSFFLGFLETRIQENGKDEFLKKYKIIGNDHVKELIEEDFIDSAFGYSSIQDIL